MKTNATRVVAMKPPETPVYIVHWKSLTERRTYLEKELSRWNVEWVDQYDRDTLTPELQESVYLGSEDLWRNRTKELYPEGSPPFRPLAKGEICNGLSHLYALRAIADLGRPGIILEDDVVPKRWFSWQFRKRLARTPSDYDIVFFGRAFSVRLLSSRSPQPKAPTQVARGVLRINAHPATRTVDAYLVSPEFAKRLITAIDKFVLPFDFELNYFLSAMNARVFWWEPGLVYQGSQTGEYGSSLR